MLSEVLQTAINDQIMHEFDSSYIYLSMAAFFEHINLPGCAHWMRFQSSEEHTHAMKLFNYVLERGGHVTLQALPQPPTEFDSPIAVFEHALAHERKISALITSLYELALQERDYPTQIALQWFITEQVEEEQNANVIVEQLRVMGTEGAGLYMLDRQLAARA